MPKQQQQQQARRSNMLHISLAKLLLKFINPMHCFHLASRLPSNKLSSFTLHETTTAGRITGVSRVGTPAEAGNVLKAEKFHLAKFWVVPYYQLYHESISALQNKHDCISKTIGETTLPPT